MFLARTYEFHLLVCKNRPPTRNVYDGTQPFNVVVNAFGDHTDRFSNAKKTADKCLRELRDYVLPQAFDQV